MKVRDIRITIKKREQVLREFGESLEKLGKGEYVEKRHELSFGNIEALRKVLTDKRIELLRVIREREPTSIYELAKFADRDLKSVNLDLAILKQLDLVSLEKSKEGRARVKPEVSFDKLNIEIALA